MHGIPEQLLGPIVMSGADRDQPIILVSIYELLAHLLGSQGELIGWP